MYRLTCLITAPVLASVGAIALGTATASAAAPSNGCPTGYTLMAVAPLTELGYQVPAAVDSSASGILSFGQPGNDDGNVCAVKLGNQTTPWDTPIYNFIDNQLPA